MRDILLRYYLTFNFCFQIIIIIIIKTDILRAVPNSMVLLRSETV